jgi:hypothetical protein
MLLSWLEAHYPSSGVDPACVGRILRLRSAAVRDADWIGLDHRWTHSGDAATGVASGKSAH